MFDAFDNDDRTWREMQQLCRRELAMQIAEAFRQTSHDVRLQSVTENDTYLLQIDLH